MKNFFRKHKVAVGIFVLALAVRAVFFAASYEINGGLLLDTIGGADYYQVIAQNIIDGHGYSTDFAPPYAPNSVRPPVMPYFLAGSYMLLGSWGAVLALYLLLGSFVPILGMWLARKITSSPAIAVGVAVFLAVEPFGVLFSTIFYSETIFMLLFFASLLYLFKYFESGRWFDLFVSASFLGFATLTKPVVQYLPVFIAVFLLYEARKRFGRTAFLRAGVYLLIFLAAISPWVYRNYLLFDTVGISSQSTVNLYSVLVPSVLAVENGTSWGEEFMALRARDAADPNSSSIAQAGYYTSRALPILLSHPLSLTLVFANTALNFFIHDGVYDVLRHLDIHPDQSMGGPALFVALKNPAKALGLTAHFAASPFALVLIGRVFWVALTILSAYGAVRYLRRERKAAGAVAIIIVLYFMLTTLVVGLAVNARYRLPVNIFIVTFAAYGAVPFILRARRGSAHGITDEIDNAQ
mgnify:FL=1